MQQAQGNFTPEQLIVAGRRAEAQGQTAHALQFYQYITQAYPSSTEAYEARDAIYRLNDPQQPQPQPQQAGYGGYPPQQGQLQPAQTQVAAPPAATVPASSMTDVRPMATLEAGTRGGKPARRKAKAAVELTDSTDDDDDLDTRSGYRVGRFVAAMLATMGWLMLLGGILLVPLMIVALTVKAVPKVVRETIAANLLATGGLTFGAIFFGLLALFAAQTARATYETADAVRHILTSRGRHD